MLSQKFSSVFAAASTKEGIAVVRIAAIPAETINAGRTKSSSHIFSRGSLIDYENANINSNCDDIGGDDAPDLMIINAKVVEHM